MTELSPRLSARYVYGIQCGEFIKIGVATDIANRLEMLRLYNPHPCKLVFKRKTVGAYQCERKMHEILNAKAIGREWFKVSVEEVRAAAAIGISHASKHFRVQKQEEKGWLRHMRTLDPTRAIDGQIGFQNEGSTRKTGTT